MLRTTKIILVAGEHANFGKKKIQFKPANKGIET